MKPIKYNIPGFFSNEKELDLFLSIIQNHTYWLEDNIEISSVYDTFGNMVWGGGRYVTKDYAPIRYAAKIIDKFNSKNISVNFTFTNRFIEKKHLNDYYSNRILETAHNKLNGIIVYSSVLEEYIRRKFPEYKIIASATCNDVSNEFIARRIEEVDFLVIPPEKNHDKKFFRLLPLKEKYEIIVNESCVPFCSLREKHYNTISGVYIEFDTESLSKLPKKSCPRSKARNTNDMVLSKNEIKKLNRMGFQYFKLQGRTEKRDVYYNYLIKYLIKDKFHISMKEEIIKYL